MRTKSQREKKLLEYLWILINLFRFERAARVKQQRDEENEKKTAQCQWMKTRHMQTHRVSIEMSICNDIDAVAHVRHKIYPTSSNT